MQTPECHDQQSRIQLEVCSQWFFPGSILAPVLFKLFINDLDKGVECTLKMFADGTNLGGVADTLEGWPVIQQDL